MPVGGKEQAMTVEELLEEIEWHGASACVANEINELREQLIQMCRVFHAEDCICKWCNIVKERAEKGVADMGFVSEGARKRIKKLENQLKRCAKHIERTIPILKYRRDETTERNVEMYGPELAEATMLLNELKNK